MQSAFFSEVYQAAEPFLPVAFTALAVSAAFLTSMHVILSRRDPGSSVAWIALVWLAPLVGVLSYLAFGINRIKRRAESLRPIEDPCVTIPAVDPVSMEEISEFLDAHQARYLRHLKPLVDRVVRRPLLPGSRLTPLFDGDGAYPAMLEAIENAQSTINFVTYIFDNDEVGRRFVDAFADATKRGVEVRVLIDAAGLRYTFPSIVTRLRKAGVNFARFLPSLFPPSIMTINLRNHRKIMVVDGELGFTGGINIRAHHVLDDQPRFPARDLHFKVEGPVVAHLQEVFADDWQFTTDESLRGERFFPPLTNVGSTLARGIPDGPDEDLDKLRWTVKGSITAARDRIRIVTPYFIPDPSMVSALGVAALRGVEVDIILPGVNNLPFVQWASNDHLRPLLERGCRVFYSPPPFDHSKLMIVDRTWFCCGSANIDPRSLRLNFEFNLECWDPPMAADLDDYLSSRIEQSEELTLEAYDERSRLVELRDGAAALMSPYL